MPVWMMAAFVHAHEAMRANSNSKEFASDFGRLSLEAHPALRSILLKLHAGAVDASAL